MLFVGGKNVHVTISGCTGASTITTLRHPYNKSKKNMMLASLAGYELRSDTANLREHKISFFYTL